MTGRKESRYEPRRPNRGGRDADLRNQTANHARETDLPSERGGEEDGNNPRAVSDPSSPSLGVVQSVVREGIHATILGQSAARDRRFTLSSSSSMGTKSATFTILSPCVTFVRDDFDTFFPNRHRPTNSSWEVGIGTVAPGRHTRKHVLDCGLRMRRKGGKEEDGSGDDQISLTHSLALPCTNCARPDVFMRMSWKKEGRKG